MELLLFLLGLILGSLIVYIFFKQTKDAKDTTEPLRLEAERRAYQAEVLREIAERIGYSLDVAKIIEIITGSLDKLLDYHTVSYMLLAKERIVFKCHVRESVNRAFIATVRTKMLAAFAAMLNRELNEAEVDESITGTILDESVKDEVASYFNIPLVISGEVTGLITVASPKPNLYNEEQTVILYTITAQASTAVSKLAHVLESEKGKLNALVSSLTDGIIMVDPSWNLLVVNPRTSLLLSLPTMGATMLDILDRLSGKIDLRTKIEEAIKKDTTITIPDVFLSTSPTMPKQARLQIAISPVKDKNGDFLGTVVAFHDITEEKALEKMREEFTAMMIHDLRSPLNNIRATSEALKRDLTATMPKELQNSLAVIRNQANDMLTLVSDLLDIAKIESGKFTVTKEPTDLSNLLREVVERYLATAAERKLGLIYKTEGDLSQIPLDHFRIRQVLSNLISNALKFTESGEVRLSAKRSEHEATIAVTDTGLGIPKDELPLLFTKFKQLYHGVTSAEGTGLGLVIAKGIVEAHGGKIWVESEVGTGTTVTFTIPI